LPGLIHRLSRETRPSVERRSALFAAAARLDPHGVCDALDGVAQTYFLFDEESRKPNPMRLTLRLLSAIRAIYGCFFLVHDGFFRL
jgi:hypothetical protein